MIDFGCKDNTNKSDGLWFPGNLLFLPNQIKMKRNRSINGITIFAFGENGD